MEISSFRETLEKFKIPLSLSLIGVVLIIGGIFYSGPSSKSRPEEYPKESIVGIQKQISIDVSGAVTKPGVYKLDSTSRVEDALKAAGGISEAANKDYVSKYLNMAQRLQDGMKIYVPFEGEVGVQSSGGFVAGASSQTQVNINSATQSELEALPGIGPVTAAKIISGRPYQKIDDLLNQKIVSKSTFEKIKDSIVVY